MEAHSKPPITPSRQERSQSFSLFSSILARRRYSRSDALEPIEVAPGVMSTDAMAIVFELDPRRTKSTSPRKQKYKKEGEEARERTVSRLPVWRAYRAAHEDDGTDDFSKHPARVATTSYFEKRDRRRDEAKMNHLRAEQQAARGRRVRMRDSEDYLTVRFANPATGLVSPSLMSDGNTTPSETNAGVGNQGRPSQGVEEQRNESHIEDLKRQQGDILRRKSSRWNVAQTPMLSPIPQSSGTGSPARRGTSNPTVNPGDRFILHMPSAQEPCPFEHPGKTSEQILAYQQGVETARAQAAGGLVDPSTPPSPRADSPSEEHRISSYPDRSPAMIRRKPVGSAASRRSESEDTVIINGARRSASLPYRNPSRPAIKVTSPEHITRNLSSISNQTSSQYLSQSQQPFLGGLADDGSTQVNDIPYRSTWSQGVENLLHHHQSRQDIDQSQLHRPPYRSPSHLPKVNITHPDLASIPTSQRPRGNKSVAPWNLQDVFTTTTPIITTTTGLPLRIKVPQRHRVPPPPGTFHRGGPSGRSTTPERRDPQLNQRDSLLVPQTQNTEGLVQHADSPHPPCLVPDPQAQAFYQNIRTFTSTFPQVSRHRTAEGPQHPTRQNGRVQRIGPLEDSARDQLPARASVTSGGLYGIDRYGGHEARNDTVNDSKALGKRVRKVATINYHTATVEIQNSGTSDGAPSTVHREDQLTGWRGVGRWPQLDSEEIEAREKERAKDCAFVRDDVTRKTSPRDEAREKKPQESASTPHRNPNDKPKPRPNRDRSDWRSAWPAALITPLTAHPLLKTLLAMLTHIRATCTPWSPTNQLLTNPESSMADYLQAAKAWALAGFYVGVLVYAGLVGWGLAGVVREVGRCLVLGGR